MTKLDGETVSKFCPKFNGTKVLNYFKIQTTNSSLLQLKEWATAIVEPASKLIFFLMTVDSNNVLEPMKMFHIFICNLEKCLQSESSNYIVIIFICNLERDCRKAFNNIVQPVSQWKYLISLLAIMKNDCRTAFSNCNFIFLSGVM